MEKFEKTEKDIVVTALSITEKYKQALQGEEVLDVQVYTSCNFALVHRNVFLISGANCIEKIFSNVFIVPKK
jgi:hypothetical protein